MIQDSTTDFGSSLESSVMPSIIAPTVIANATKLKYIDQKLVAGGARRSELDLIGLLAQLEEVEEICGIQWSFLLPYSSMRISLVIQLRSTLNIIVRSSSFSLSLSAMTRNAVT